MSHPSSATCHNTAQRTVPPCWRLATAAQQCFSYLTCKLMPQPDWLTLFSKRRRNAFWGCRLNIGWHTNYLFLALDCPLFKWKHHFRCKTTREICGTVEVEGQNSQTGAEILERRQNGQTAAEASAISKGRPGLILLESRSSGLFGYSFNVQQSLHTPYSSISCPPGSRW